MTGCPKSLFSAFSGADGKTALIAAAATLGMVVFLALTVASFMRVDVAFDGAGFAAGWSIVLGASAAAIAGHAWGQAKADAIPAAPDAGPATTNQTGNAT